MINLGKKTKIEYDPNELYVGSIQRVIRWEHLGHRHDEDYETVQDFAIFYRDMSEDFAKYSGKTVRFKGIVALDSSLPSGHFAIGRHIMTCCEADIAYRGVVAKGMGSLKLKTRDWVTVEGVLNEEYSKLYKAKGPVLTVKKISKSEKPQQEVATFY